MSNETKPAQPHAGTHHQAFSQAAQRKRRWLGLVLTVALAGMALGLLGGGAANGQAIGGGRGQSPASRVQNRTYLFADTNEKLPYAVFVSTKVSRDKKAPLIIALHGLGGSTTTLLRGTALQLAEEGGYILVGPMGYNSSGWYGMPSPFGRGIRGPVAGPQAQPATQPIRGPFRGGFGPAGGTAVTDPAKVRELSEKDVMNVLELIRKEYSVDDRRTYLMGHSMGGGGTLWLGEKYASNWAAIAAIAPAAFGIQPNSIAKIKDMPVMIVQGDADVLVRPDGSRRWADKMKELKMDYEYDEIAGADHGTVVNRGMADVFKFFAKHSKPEATTQPATRPEMK